MSEQPQSTDVPVEQGGVPESFLRRGEMVPAFVLPGADGMPHGPWDYKQRENLLMVFLSNAETDETRSVLRELKQQYKVLREAECALLAVTGSPVVAHLQVQAALQLPFPLLADPQGTVSARYTYRDAQTRLTTPSFVLANRYGVFQVQWLATHEANLPPITVLLDELQFLNTLCNP